MLESTASREGHEEPYQEGQDNGGATAQLETFSYDDSIVRMFVTATLVWGVIGFLVGMILAVATAVPGPQRRHRVDQLRPIAAAAHQCRDLCFRRQCHLRGHLLLHSAALQGADVERPAQPPALLGLAVDYRQRRANAAVRYYAEQGIRRTRVANRYRDRRRMGRLPLAATSS